MSKYLKTLITVLKPNAQIPARHSEEAAGYDVYSTAEVLIKPFSAEKIPLGIALCPPDDHYFQICSRSGMNSKLILNLHSTIDPDYRGEVFAILFNATSELYIVKERHRVGQLVLRPLIQTRFALSEALPSSNRGTAGFGSTGA